MKTVILIGFLILPFLTFAQEKWSYQSDSLYKANKVKVRKRFNQEKSSATTYYDQEGRMTKIVHAPYMGGAQVTTHFVYDQKDLLIQQVDSIRNGKPDRKALKELKKIGLDVSSIMDNNKPKLQVSKYDIEYTNRIISKLTKYKPDGIVDHIDYFENNGKKQIRKWYRNGEVYKESITEYIDEFHKNKYYGWYIGPNSKKREWSYTFEYEFKDGQISEFVRFDNGIRKETTVLTYNNNRLLTQAKNYTIERFEYEYYK